MQVFSPVWLFTFARTIAVYFSKLYVAQNSKDLRYFSVTIWICDRFIPIGAPCLNFFVKQSKGQEKAHRPQGDSSLSIRKWTTPRMKFWLPLLCAVCLSDDYNIGLSQTVPLLKAKKKANNPQVCLVSPQLDGTRKAHIQYKMFSLLFSKEVGT